MGFGCPHRRISYSRWRLNILNELFGSLPGPQQSPPLPFLQPPSIRRSPSTRRHYSSGLRGSPAPPESKETPKLDKAHDGDNHGRVWSTRQSRSPKYNPYTEQSRQDMRDVVQALQDLADEEDRGVNPRTGMPMNYKSYRLLELPQSPIFKKRSKLDTPLKDRPSPEALALSSDPWARMLADPVRLCRASSARLPISLLSNWGLTYHPTNGEVYLVPHQLADLETLEKIGTRRELQRREEMARAGVEDEFAPSDDHGVLDPPNESGRDTSVEQNTLSESPADDSEALSLPTLSPTPRNPGPAPAVRILPYDNLINLLSLSHKGRNNVVLKLLSPLYLKRFEDARYYEHQRKTFSYLTAEDDNTPPPIEATLDVTKLQWQVDIADRLLDILRRRVVTVFAKVALSSRSRRKKRLRHVSAIPMSRILKLLQEPQSQRLSGHNESEAEDPYSDTGHNYEGSPDSSPRGENHVDLDRPLSTRVFLYMGPLESPAWKSMRFGLRNEPALLSGSMVPPLLPSLSSATTQRFPVFPLQAMLGEKRLEEVMRVVGEYEYLLPRKIESNDEGAETAGGGEFLIMLKPAADNALIEILLREVWRLWRYGGGKRWMSADANELWRDEVRRVVLNRSSGTQNTAGASQAAGDHIVEETVDGDVGPGLNDGTTVVEEEEEEEEPDVDKKVAQTA